VELSLGYGLGHDTLYIGKEVVKRAIPVESACDAPTQLIKVGGTVDGHPPSGAVPCVHGLHGPQTIDCTWCASRHDTAGEPSCSVEMYVFDGVCTSASELWLLEFGIKLTFTAAGPMLTGSWCCAQDHDRWVDPPKEEEESGQENQKELIAA